MEFMNQKLNSCDINDLIFSFNFIILKIGLEDLKVQMDESNLQ